MVGDSRKGLLLHAALRAARKSMLTIPHVKLELGEGCFSHSQMVAIEETWPQSPIATIAGVWNPYGGALRTMTNIADYSIQVPRFFSGHCWKLPPLHSIPLTPETAGQRHEPSSRVAGQSSTKKHTPRLRTRKVLSVKAIQTSTLRLGWWRGPS